MNDVGATVLTLNADPVLRTAIVPADPPDACEFNCVKSVLGASTPGAPTVRTHVEVTAPVN